MASDEITLVTAALSNALNEVERLRATLAKIKTIVDRVAVHSASMPYVAAHGEIVKLLYPEAS